MQMRLQLLPINPALRGFIEKMWIFESSGRVSDADLKLVVPNGFIKLVIPYKNGLSGTMEGCSHMSKEHEITLIGICDLPSIVVAEKDEPSGTIGIEFNPLGAYRFFKIKQSDIRNSILPLEDVIGKLAKDLEEKIANVEDVSSKVFFIQQFLLNAFLRQPQDLIFDFCITKIKQSNGSIAVKQLEKETGYSSRWLHMKFEERIGVSPKNLSSILRFQQVYTSLVMGKQNSYDIYNFYYDQSHFIKEFKRYTGLSPSKFESEQNDFGKIFYKE